MSNPFYHPSFNDPAVQQKYSNYASNPGEALFMEQYDWNPYDAAMAQQYNMYTGYTPEQTGQMRGRQRGNPYAGYNTNPDAYYADMDQNFNPYDYYNGMVPSQAANNFAQGYQLMRMLGPSAAPFASSLYNQPNALNNAAHSLQLMQMLNPSSPAPSSALMQWLKSLFGG